MTADEDYYDGPYEMTVAQEIRARSLHSAAVLLSHDVGEIVEALPDSNPKGDLLDLWLICASAGGRFITNGLDVEPTPPLDGAGAAEEHGETEGLGT